MFQQVIVIGYLGQDVEERATGNGTVVANFSVAASEKWKDKGGEQQEHTEWFRCTAFGRTAEIASEYLKKGYLVTVIGRMRTEKYEDKDGNERYSVKLIVGELKLMPNQRGEGSPQRSSEREERPAQRGNQSRREEPPKRAPADADFDDDIPF